MDEMFCRFSPPEQLLSDHGRQFESQLMAEDCKLLGIQKSRTTPYHLQCDGLVERWNRTLLQNLATSVTDHPENWEVFVKKICILPYVWKTGQIAGGFNVWDTRT